MKYKIFLYILFNKGRCGTGLLKESFQGPKLIQFPITKVVIKGMSAGKTHCLAWNNEGKMYSWGHALYGKLGSVTLNQSFNYIEYFPKRVFLNFIQNYYKY